MGMKFDVFSETYMVKSVAKNRTGKLLPSDTLNLKCINWRMICVYKNMFAYSVIRRKIPE